MITCFFAFSVVESVLAIINETGSAHVAGVVSRMEEKIEMGKEVELESHNYVQCLRRKLNANLHNRIRRYIGRPLL